MLSKLGWYGSYTELHDWFGLIDSVTDDLKYSSVVRVKPSHYQCDSSHIGSATSSDHSTDHRNQSEPVVYAKVNKHRTTEKTTAKKSIGEHSNSISC